MAQTFSAADAILKDDYAPSIVEQINQNTWLLDKIQRDSEKVDARGRRAIVPLHTARNRKRGSRAAGGTLPTGGQQGYQDAIIPIRYHYYTIEIEDALVKAATGNNSGAFLDAVDGETEGVAQDMKKDVTRQAYGDGTGLLGTCASASGSTFTMGSKQDVQYVAVGDPVDIVVKSSGATSAGVVNTSVTAVSVANKTFITADAPATAGSIDNTYGVYIAGNRNLESDGLRNIANTGRTLHSVNSSTAGNEFWDGQVVTVGTSSTALVAAGEDSYRQLFNKVGSSGSNKPDVFLTSRGGQDVLYRQYQSQRRLNDAKAIEIEGGYTGINVNMVPVVFDDNAPYTDAFAIKNEALKWYEQDGPGWLEMEDSGVWHLKAGSTAGTHVANWVAYWEWYAALGCHRPNAIGRLKLIIDYTNVSG